MKWLIIGTGWISESFIKSLRNNQQEVYAILSRNQEKANEFARIHNIPFAFSSYEEALKVVDAVYVGTPNTTHYEYAKQAILSHKATMVEKPMTHSFEKTKELIDLAKTTSIPLMEGYIHITQPEFLNFKGTYLKTNYLQLSSKIKNGTFKEASSFNKELFGGVIPDLGVYPISLSILVLGKVKEIFISNVKYLNNVEVECDIKLICENGKAEFSISKIKDGDNRIFIDDKEVYFHVNGGSKENKMNNEIKIFLENKDLDFFNNISLEVARVVEQLKEKC